VTLACGYDGPVRTAPCLHVVGTFRSTGLAADEAPDLMLWLSDPGGDPPAFEIDAVLLRPQSAGRVSLRSADPRQPPRIELPAPTERADADRLAEGVRRAAEVASHPELRRCGAIPPEPVPAGGAELRAFIEAERYTLPHMVGTCALGAVVGPDGSVHGTRALSVADASVIPEALSGFPHLPTIMVAERVAERLAQHAPQVSA
jgi:choline dehydrogenase